MARIPLEFKPNCASAYPILAVGALSFAAGVWQRNAAAMALGFVLLAAPPLLWIGLRRSVRALKLHRWAPETAFEGESVEIGVELENASRLPLFYPQVAESFAPEIHTQKDLLFTSRVQGGESVSDTYRGQCVLPRGIYQLGPTAVRVADPFGLFEVRKYFGGRQSLKVYPQVHKIGTKERLGECIAEVAQDLTRNTHGESTSYLSVREYRRGDSLRRVHWGLTAHAGFPVVKEYSRTSTGNISIFLDLHSHALIGWGRNSSIEIAVKIVASVGAAAVRRGRSVQLLGGRDQQYFVPEGRGPAQLKRILEMLVAVRPYSEPGEDAPALPDLMQESQPLLKSGTTLLVMVSPYLFPDAAFERRLRRLRARGHRVAVVIFDGETFHHVWDPPRQNANVVEYAARLRALGLDTYVIPCGARLEAVFREDT